jgi:lactoylglutathione lyase
VPYLVNHIHLKSADPKTTADWFVDAFNIKIVTDTTRNSGDRFIVTHTEGGLAINISGARSGEALGPADADPHYGLEHFGFDSADIDADIERLVGMGATLKDAPREAAPGVKIAFIAAPGNVRIELIQRG